MFSDKDKAIPDYDGQIWRYKKGWTGILDK